jgi:hypothetical protein
VAVEVVMVEDMEEEEGRVAEEEARGTKKKGQAAAW